MSYKRRFRTVRTARWAAVVLFLQIACPVGNGYAASEANPENFRIELTGAAWLVDSSGIIQAGGTPVDLVKDLGAGQQQSTFFGRMVFKPGRKQRIVLEGTPFRLSGYNTVDRSIVYRGQIFDVHQTLRSSAELNYFFAGYQYDVLSGSMGHLGLSAGAAYLGSTGTISSLELGTTATKTETFGLPLAGLEGRIFPVRHHAFLTIEGDIKGMDVGAYGHYLEVSGSGGVNLSHLAFLAGYRTVDPDIHSSSANPAGVNAHLKGPIFSAQWRW